MVLSGWAVDILPDKCNYWRARFVIIPSKVRRVRPGEGEGLEDGRGAGLGGRAWG